MALQFTAIGCTVWFLRNAHFYYYPQTNNIAIGVIVVNTVTAIFLSATIPKTMKSTKIRIPFYIWLTLNALTLAALPY